MKFQCTDCGTCFDTKPEYCDCGNNTFIELTPHPIQEKQLYVQEMREQHIAQKSSIYDDFDDYKPQKKQISQADILSFAFLLVCIILSICIWLFLGDTKQQPKTENKTESKQEKTLNIPNLDSFWDDTPPVITKTTTQQTIQQAQTSQVKVVQPQQKQTTLKQQQKVQNKPKLKTTVSKPKPTTVQQSKPKQQAQIQQRPKVQQNTTQNTKPKTTTTQTQPQPQQQVQPVQKQTTVKNNEVEKYKTNLRIALFNRLDVTSIQGSGTAVVSFAIDKNGKLLSRRFEKQSDNRSLNDALYNMLMKLPVYNPPPSTYKGETIKLQFKINNGQYSISYI